MDPAEQFLRANTELTPTPLVPEVSLHLAVDIEALWQLTGGDEPPFWAFAWAGGQGVARYLLDSPSAVAGRSVFDLACGSGLVGIAASVAGAESVVCCDVDPLAGVAARVNAAANGVAVGVQVADVLDGPVDAQVVVAGDVFYDRDMAERVWPFLARVAAGGAAVLVGDPSNRPYLPRRRCVAVAEYVVPVTRELEGVRELVTTVWRVVG
ncbi:class I SAM-dependent methyltransferase [Kutzneria albida]|uniref:Methyltransferase n=1 Tax=Kutzneria albida DSM 43870 TaxID=1449976 RepID=W5WHS3_9PSEU|nr:50S ribosomal protein L11 methyltransferase [Kutzneria albida]AHH97704.1 hypothetical protein KALB_4342 [Kutzneria albida DSM 43870]